MSSISWNVNVYRSVTVVRSNNFLEFDANSFYNYYHNKFNQSITIMKLCFSATAFDLPHFKGSEYNIEKLNIDLIYNTLP